MPKTPNTAIQPRHLTPTLRTELFKLFGGDEREYARAALLLMFGTLSRAADYLDMAKSQLTNELNNNYNRKLSQRLLEAVGLRRTESVVLTTTHKADTKDTPTNEPTKDCKLCGGSGWVDPHYRCACTY